MEMLEYKADKVLRYLEAFCPKLNIDLSTISGLNDPPPVHRSCYDSDSDLSARLLTGYDYGTPKVSSYISHGQSSQSA